MRTNLHGAGHDRRRQRVGKQVRPGTLPQQLPVAYGDVLRVWVQTAIRRFLPTPECQLRKCRTPYASHLLREVLPCHSAAGNDSPQDRHVSELLVWDQVRVIVHAYHHDLLAEIAIRVRMLDNIEKSTVFDVEHYVLERDVALRLELLVFGVVPREVPQASI